MAVYLCVAEDLIANKFGRQADFNILGKVTDHVCPLNSCIGVGISINFDNIQIIIRTDAVNQVPDVG